MGGVGGWVEEWVLLKVYVLPLPDWIRWRAGCDWPFDSRAVIGCLGAGDGIGCCVPSDVWDYRRGGGGGERGRGGEGEEKGRGGREGERV